MSKQETDAGLIVEIYDGPQDKPNCRRTIEVICWDSMPGIVLCRDTKTGETLRIDRQKIEAAKLKRVNKA